MFLLAPNSSVQHLAAALAPSPIHDAARWVELRRKPPSQRKVAVLLYGFPPGVGSTGTAALLNVPRSLEAALSALQVRAGGGGLRGA
jgi:hypothetical protein